MAGRSQSESEQPAKVYQLDAVEAKVDQALAKLDNIATSVSSVVNRGELQAAIKESEDRIMEQVADEVKQIHLKYGPTYKGIWWVVAALVMGLLSLLWGALNDFWRGN